MTPTDFTHATEAHHPVRGQTATRSHHPYPWASETRFPNGLHVARDREMADWGFIPGPAPVEEDGPTFHTNSPCPTVPIATPTIPSWEDIPEGVREVMVERGARALHGYPEHDARTWDELHQSDHDDFRDSAWRMLCAAFTPEPARPDGNTPPLPPRIGRATTTPPQRQEHDHG